MANNYFTGASTGTGDITVAANYSLGALTPASDVLIFDRTTFDLFGDITGLGNFQGVQITSGWKGKMIGTAAAPLKIKLAASKTWDIASNPYLELVHVGAGSGTIAKLRAAGILQIVINGGTVTDLELDACGSVTGVIDTTFTNIRLSNCPNVLLDNLGSGTGSSIIIVTGGTGLTTKRAAASGCATYIGPGSYIVVADPGSLGSSGNVQVWGTLTYKSSVAGPSFEVFPGGKVNENGSTSNITYGTVRDWIGSEFVDRPTGITVTPSSRVPVCKAT